MRGLLINKNLSLYYLLKKRIGKEKAYKLENALGKVTLIFGREALPYSKQNGMLNRGNRNEEIFVK